MKGRRIGWKKVRVIRSLPVKMGNLIVFQWGVGAHYRKGRKVDLTQREEVEK